MISGLPKEHGATVMAACALLAGAGTGAAEPGPFDPRSVLLMGAALIGLFLVREPVGNLWRRDRPLGEKAKRDSFLVLAVALLLVGGGGLGVALRLPLVLLVILASIGLPFFAFAIWTRVSRLERRVWAELLGVFALALPALAAHVAATGRLGIEAWKGYSACLLFYVGSTMHLRVLWRDRKASRRGAPVRDLHWLWSVGATVGGLGLGVAGWFNPVAAMGFAVALLRPLLVRGRLLDHPVRVGLLETALTVLFVASVVAGAGTPGGRERGQSAWYTTRSQPAP